jgi:L-amino acid N-acyltransferase YncA
MRSIISTRAWLANSEKFQKASFLGCLEVQLAVPFDAAGKVVGYSLYLFKYQNEQFATFGKLSGFNQLANHEGDVLSKLLAQSLLEQAKQHHFSFLVGPMDGDTWHSYRCLDRQGSEPAFTLEPQLQLDSATLRQAGFEVISSYGSSIENLGTEVLYLKDHSEDVCVEALAGMAFEDVMSLFYEAALLDFNDNFFYRPINQASFLSIYKPLAPLLNLDFVLAAREKKTGLPVGLIFAYGDQELAQRLIIKTIHVNKNKRGRGISRLLLNSMHARAFKHGFKQVIHALYKSDNKSRQLSMSMGAKRFAEYLLWGKNINGVSQL